jgi:ADP-ribose pyrophosphatase
MAMTMSDGSELAEELVRSEKVFQGRLLTIKVDEVRLPDGASARREVVDHPGAVSVVAVTGNREVVMVRQWRHAVGEALVEIPAGTLKAGEDPAVCAGRELMEEAGFEPGSLELLAEFWSAPGFLREYMRVYLALDLKPASLPADEDERVEPLLVPWDEALRMCADGTVRDAKSLAGLLMAQRRLGW